MYKRQEYTRTDIAHPRIAEMESEIEEAHESIDELVIRIAEMENLHNESMDNYDELGVLLATRFPSIAELEAQLKAKAWVDRPMRDPTERYELTNDEWCAETDDTNAPPCGWIGLEP